MKRDEARKIVNSWQCLHFYPKEDEALIQVINAVEGSVRSGPHADAFKGYVMRNLTDFPAPADVYRIASETSPQVEVGCADCDGTGFKHVTVDGYSFSRPCKCRAPIPTGEPA